MSSITIAAKIIHYSLLILTLLFLITGLGIMYYQVVEQVTGGLLAKPLNFQIHTILIIPFIVLLTLHILFSIFKKKKKEKVRR